MAKARIKRKKPAVNPEDAKATKRFFVITGVVVLVLLVVIFMVYARA